MGVQRISDNAYYLTEGNAMVTVFSDTAVSDDIGKIKSVTAKNSPDQGNIQSWGIDNDTPTAREKLVADNNITPSLISTKRDITLGQGIIAYQEYFEEGERKIKEVPMPDQVNEFFENSKMDLDDYLRNAANELTFHANVYTEFIREKADSKKIASIQVLKCKHVRAEEMDDAGNINNFFWCGNWNPERSSRLKYPVFKIPAYNFDEENKQTKFILHTGDDLLNIDGYYYSPFWWGAKAWIELANSIPDFHQSNLKHGYNIRYHIEIPKDYFSGFSPAANTPQDMEESKKRETEAKRILLQKLNDFLAGTGNSGRAMVTEYELNRAMGKEFPGIKITPLKVDLQDKALLELFEKSNQANVSAQGIHPTLANIETQGKLSSGSEIRNAFLLYVAVKTPLPRKILLKPLNLIKKINGWPKDIYFGFKDIVLQTLDENSSAMAEKTIV